MTIQEYIETINRRYKAGNATEHSYRGDLQNLLKALAPHVEVTNEPQRIDRDCGAPDTEPIALMPYLQNTLDSREASVIQTALQFGINLVCIDEILGRRTARLSNLNVTGAIGVLLKAKSRGYQVSMTDAISRMREHGIWLTQNVIDFALTH